MKKNNNDFVIKQVPPDYYQKSIEDNIFQKIWHLNKLQVVFKLIPGSPRKILDVGCAGGWMSAKLAEKFPQTQIWGIDIYEAAINHGRRLYPGIDFRVADAHRMPFKNNSFDLVICTEVLEHLDNPKVVLLEMKRVLKKNGHAIIELDSGSFLFTLVWFIWRKFKGKVWERAHLHSFSMKKLEKMILSCGFLILNKKKFNLGMAMAFLIRKV